MKSPRGEMWGWFILVKAIFNFHDGDVRCSLCVWEVDDNGVCVNDLCKRQWRSDRSILDNMDESASNAKQFNELFAKRHLCDCVRSTSRD